jgi:hypothetical protein
MKETLMQDSGAPIDERWIPYRHPMPRESPPELVVPDAIPTDERVWVPVDGDVWFRPLCLSVSRGYWVNLLRVRRAGVLSRHRANGAISSTTGSRARAAMSTRRRARRTRWSSTLMSRR